MLLLGFCLQKLRSHQNVWPRVLGFLIQIDNVVPMILALKVQVSSECVTKGAGFSYPNCQSCSYDFAFKSSGFIRMFGQGCWAFLIQTANVVLMVLTSKVQMSSECLAKGAGLLIQTANVVLMILPSKVQVSSECLVKSAGFSYPNCQCCSYVFAFKSSGLIRLFGQGCWAFLSKLPMLFS